MVHLLCTQLVINKDSDIIDARFMLISAPYLECALCGENMKNVACIFQNEKLDFFLCLV